MNSPDFPRPDVLSRLVRPEFPFIRLRWLFPLLAVLVLSTAWLIVRFRALDSDSIMYGLPLANASGPFSLAVPMLGDFPPYSTVWGHQWPGSMWLRGALYAVVPFQRWLDIALLLSLQVAAAFLAGRLVWSLTRAHVASVGTTIIILSDRVLIASLQLHRFEPLVIFALVGLLITLVALAGRRPAGRVAPDDGRLLLFSFVAAFVAASSHPFGMVIAGGLLGLAGIDWLILRRRTALAALTPSLGFVCGLAAIGLYFALLPDAREQFLQNLALQNSFNNGSRLAFVAHLAYYKVLGYVLWGGVIFAVPWVFLRLRSRANAREAFAAWALPLAALAVPALFTLTRSANNSYSALGTPFAAILVGVGIGLIPRPHPRLVSTLAQATFAVLAVGFFSVYPYRWLVFLRSGTPNFPAEMRAVLDRLPAGSRIFIPPPLWDVARNDPHHDFRLYTLSIASPKERRLAYERKVYGEAKAGDVLVVDRISGTTGDPWGILPTFETRPPDPVYWRPLFEAVRRFPGAGHDFGYDLAVYEFRGVPWDPGSSPRTSISGR